VRLYEFIKLIYYDIQHHGHVERLEWLVSQLFHSKNHINVTYDGNIENLSLLKKLKKPDDCLLSFSSSIPVTWCGPSQIFQMKKSLETALQSPHWEYFVNLSGVDIPLVSQKSFLDKLAFERKQNNKTSFCFGFKPNKSPYWLRQTEEFRRVERKYSRLQIVCDSEVNQELMRGELDPIKRVMERRALYCEEIGNKRLFVRSLTQDEINYRKAFWAKHSYMVGRTWMVLHRKQVEWLAESRLFTQIFEHLQTTFQPDETLYPSVLFSDQNPFIHELSKDNLRYGLGTPKSITPNDLTTVLNSKACFARKLHHSVSESDLGVVSQKISHKGF
jgi:hypothetical protein